MASMKNRVDSKSLENKKPTKTGIVYWLTGLSGVGKTTLARALIKRFSRENKPIWLDGDPLREVYGNTSGYSYKERKKVAFKNARLCKYLSDQGFNVVCSTISLFHEVQNWNKENIPNYIEIWIKTPLNILEERDPKMIYQTRKNNLDAEVAGLDVAVEFPKKPDFTIENRDYQSINKSIELILSNKLE